MASSIRQSLPFTLALAFIVYLSSFVPAVNILSAPTALVLGVVLGGLLVPLLIQYKPLESAGAVNTNASTTAAGPTVTLYVGNLPYKANEDAVKVLFQRFGTVNNVRLMKDRQTGRRRGFGFVEVSASDSDKMVRALNEFEYDGRTLKVREAKEKTDNEDADNS